jgi:alkylation response protein AidB-like acyl-CoA dehydrogenase
MNLSLTQSQEMLKTAAREMVEQEFSKETLADLDAQESSFHPAGWQKLASAGWLGILVPQEYGGEGSSLTDAAVLFQELGRGPVPGPHFSSAVLGALTVLEAATQEQKTNLLPKVATGEVVLAPAVTEANYDWGPDSIHAEAKKRDGGFLLNGTKLFVQDALGATHLLCAARMESGGIGLLSMEANSPGLTISPLAGFTTGVCQVSLNDVEVPSSALLGGETRDGWESFQKAVTRALPVLCAYQVGGCERVFEMTLDYSNTRVQFGMPIGRFQRVQDHIIEIVNQLDAARWTTYEALSKLDGNKTGVAVSVHMTKAVTSEAYYRVCNAGHEVHAGVGIMRKYGLTLHTKMSRTLYHYLGDPSYHKQLLGEALDL